jgi:hypothetical protein
MNGYRKGKENKMQNDKLVNFRLPTETWNVLDQQAQKAGVTLSWWLRKILTEHVNNPTIRLPIIEFTGRGDQIGEAFKKEA